MITTNDEKVASFVRNQINQSGYPDKKGYKRNSNGNGYVCSDPSSCVLGDSTSAVVLGNKMGKDPIHERFGESECVYSELGSYQQYGKALATAVGMKQLERIERLNGARRKNGQALVGLKGLKILNPIIWGLRAYFVYVIHHKDRERFASIFVKEELIQRQDERYVRSSYFRSIVCHVPMQQSHQAVASFTSASNLSAVDRQHLINPCEKPQFFWVEYNGISIHQCGKYDIINPMSRRTYALWTAQLYTDCPCCMG